MLIADQNTGELFFTKACGGKTVGSEISHLQSDKGYSHDRAVAAAMSMEREGKVKPTKKKKKKKIAIKKSINKSETEKCKICGLSHKGIDGKELEMGIEEEKEEHKMGEQEAHKTAMQHLEKDNKYYTKIKKIGL